MAALLIEIGNTALKASWADGMTLGKAFRYQGEKKLEFILSLTAKEKPSVMVLASACEVTPYEQNILEQECGHLEILDPVHKRILSECGLPDYLTYDRAASVIAARYLFWNKGCTIFDFGTTLTVDFTDVEGRYEEGFISPGCRTRFKAINRYSRTLPLMETPENAPENGTSLEASIGTGIISGIMFEIQGWIDKHPGNVVVFTGGDAIYFAKRMKNSIFVVCNLVLLGLALIARDHVEEKN